MNGWRWPGQTAAQAEEVARHVPAGHFYRSYNNGSTVSARRLSSLVAMARAGDWLAALELEKFFGFEAQQPPRQLVSRPLQFTDDELAALVKEEADAYFIGVYLCHASAWEQAQKVFRKYQFASSRVRLAYLHATRDFATLRAELGSYTGDDPLMLEYKAVLTHDVALFARIGTPHAYYQAGAHLNKDPAQSIAFLKMAIKGGYEKAVLYLFIMHGDSAREDRALLEELCTDTYHSFEQAHVELGEWYWRHQQDDPTFRGKAVSHLLQAGTIHGFYRLRVCGIGPKEFRRSLRRLSPAESARALAPWSAVPCTDGAYWLWPDELENFVVTALCQK